MTTVLIIDDDADLRLLYKEILEQAGYEVMDAADGAAGISLYRTHRPDVVITDIVMPEKEGLETIKELGQDFPGVKIIAVSGGFHNMDAAACLNMARLMGARRTLPKPVPKKVLIETVQAVLAEE